MRQTLALFMILCAWAPLAAQRPETPETPPGATGLPNLSGIWHRQGPLNGKPNPQAVPTNRAAGFEKAFDDAYNPTYDCSATPIPGLINDNYDFQIMQLPDLWTRRARAHRSLENDRTVFHSSHRPSSFLHQGDISIELRMGTFLTSLDTTTQKDLTAARSVHKVPCLTSTWAVGDDFPRRARCASPPSRRRIGHVDSSCFSKRQQVPHPASLQRKKIPKASLDLNAADPGNIGATDIAEGAIRERNGQIFRFFPLQLLQRLYGGGRVRSCKRENHHARFGRW